jgi:hypothetical protein
MKLIYTYLYDKARAIILIYLKLEILSESVIARVTVSMALAKIAKIWLHLPFSTPRLRVILRVKTLDEAKHDGFSEGTVHLSHALLVHATLFRLLSSNPSRRTPRVSDFRSFPYRFRLR